MVGAHQPGELVSLVNGTTLWVPQSRSSVWRTDDYGHSWWSPSQAPWDIRNCSQNSTLLSTTSFVVVAVGCLEPADPWLELWSTANAAQTWVALDSPFDAAALVTPRVIHVATTPTEVGVMYGAQGFGWKASKTESMGWSPLPFLPPTVAHTTVQAAHPLRHVSVVSENMSMWELVTGPPPRWERSLVRLPAPSDKVVILLNASSTSPVEWWFAMNATAQWWSNTSGHAWHLIATPRVHDFSPSVPMGVVATIRGSTDPPLTIWGCVRGYHRPHASAACSVCLDMEGRQPQEGGVSWEAAAQRCPQCAIGWATRDNRCTVCPPGTTNTVAGAPQCWECLHRDHCRGGATCAPARRGVLCGQCRDQFYPLLGSCYQCPSIPLLTALVGLLAATVLTTLALFRVMTPDRMQTLRELVAFVQMAGISVAVHADWLPPIVVEAITTWLQTGWDGITLYSLHCVVRVDFYTSVALVVAAMAGVLAVMGLTAWVLHGMVRCHHKRHALQQVSRGDTHVAADMATTVDRHALRAKQLMITVLLLFHQPLLRKLLSVHSCTATSQGRRLVEDLATACDEFSWRWSFVVALTAALGLGCPVAMGWWLHKQQSQGTLVTFPAIAALHDPFKPKYAFMECVRIVQQSLLMTGLVVWQPDSWQQSLWCTTITATYAVSLLWLRPWDRVPRRVLCFTVRDAFNAFAVSAQLAQVVVLASGAAASAWRGFHVVTLTAGGVVSAVTALVVLVGIQFMCQHRALGTPGSTQFQIGIQEAYKRGDIATAKAMFQRYVAFMRPQLMAMRRRVATATRDAGASPCTFPETPSVGVASGVIALRTHISQVEAQLTVSPEVESTARGQMNAFLTHIEGTMQTFKHSARNCTSGSTPSLKAVVASEEAMQSHKQATIGELAKFEQGLVDTLQIDSAVHVRNMKQAMIQHADSMCSPPRVKLMEDCHSLRNQAVDYTLRLDDVMCLEGGQAYRALTRAPQMHALQTLLQKAKRLRNPWACHAVACVVLKARQRWQSSESVAIQDENRRTTIHTEADAKQRALLQRIEQELQHCARTATMRVDIVELRDQLLGNHDSTVKGLQELALACVRHGSIELAVQLVNDAESLRSHPPGPTAAQRRELKTLPRAVLDGVPLVREVHGCLQATFTDMAQRSNMWAVAKIVEWTARAVEDLHVALREGKDDEVPTIAAVDALKWYSNSCTHIHSMIRSQHWWHDEQWERLLINAVGATWSTELFLVEATKCVEWLTLQRNYAVSVQRHVTTHQWWLPCLHHVRDTLHRAAAWKACVSDHWILVATAAVLRSLSTDTPPWRVVGELVNQGPLVNSSEIPDAPSQEHAWRAASALQVPVSPTSRKMVTRSLQRIEVRLRTCSRLCQRMMTHAKVRKRREGARKIGDVVVWLAGKSANYRTAAMQEAGDSAFSIALMCLHAHQRIEGLLREWKEYQREVAQVIAAGSQSLPVVPK